MYGLSQALPAPVTQCSLTCVPVVSFACAVREIVLSGSIFVVVQVVEIEIDRPEGGNAAKQVRHTGGRVPVLGSSQCLWLQ
jgi:hypothetical protein